MRAVNSWNCYDLLRGCYELVLLARAGFSGACYELNGNLMNYATPGKRRSFEHIGENGGGSGAGGLGDASAPASAATKAPALASRIT